MHEHTSTALPLVQVHVYILLLSIILMKNKPQYVSHVNHINQCRNLLKSLSLPPSQTSIGIQLSHTNKKLPGARSCLVFSRLPGVEALRGAGGEEGCQAPPVKGNMWDGQQSILFSSLCCRDSRLQRERNAAGATTGEFKTQNNDV